MSPWFKYINIGLTIILGAALLLLPFFILIWYNINFEKFEDEHFEKRYGEVYAGMNPRKRTSIYYVPFFLLRRYALALTICFTVIVVHNFWLQIAIQIISCLLSAVLLIQFTPF